MAPCYRALESVSMIASALSTALTIYPCQIRVHQRWQSNSRLQLLTARKKEWWPATADSLPPGGYLSTVKHNCVSGNRTYYLPIVSPTRATDYRDYQLVSLFNEFFAMFDREINTVDELSFNVLWCNKLVIRRHKECSIILFLSLNDDSAGGGVSSYFTPHFDCTFRRAICLRLRQGDWQITIIKAKP